MIPIVIEISKKASQNKNYWNDKKKKKSRRNQSPK
jgi:hypothetical protein